MEEGKYSLKAARVNAGLTQEESAAELGVTQKTLSAYENGKQFPDVRMIKKIEQLYGISYNNLIFLI